MRVSLIGAELEENLGLRYIAAALEQAGHDISIIPFASEHDAGPVVSRVTELRPDIAGLSMVFTGRGREFCRLARALREGGYRGHLIGGGHFASFNCRQLLCDYPEFDSIALGEGEELMCRLAGNLESPENVPGLCYRRPDGSLTNQTGKIYRLTLFGQTPEKASQILPVNFKPEL